MPGATCRSRADAGLATGRPDPPRQPSRLKRMIRRIFAAYVMYMISLAACQRYLVFPRYAAKPLPDAGQGVPGLERVWIDTPEGRVEGYFLPGAGASADRPGPAVIFAHGNAELIDHWPLDMAAYRAAGISVLLPEYRGYGRSAGSPTESKINQDMLKFHDWLTARPEVDQRRIIYHGRSIGGGAVCALATQRPPAAMILQSTFISVRELSKRYFVPSFLIVDPFDNESAIARLDCPILLFHGRRDTIVPYWHAEQLKAAARNARLISLDADHNNCPPDWDAFMRDVLRFLRDHGLTRAAPGR